MQENPSINQQDRQKIMYPESVNPKEISQQCTPATHTRGCSWGLPSLSLTTKGSWIHLWGEGCQASRQLSDASTPPHWGWEAELATFPVAMHHLSCPLAGTKLYSLATEARVLTTCPGLQSTVGRLGFKPATYWSQVQHATEPHWRNEQSDISDINYHTISNVINPKTITQLTCNCCCSCDDCSSASSAALCLDSSHCISSRVFASVANANSPASSWTRVSSRRTSSWRSTPADSSCLLSLRFCDKISQW